MKKIILLVLFLLLAPSLFADDYLDSLAEHVATVKHNLGWRTNSTIIADSVIERYVRMSYALLAPVIAGRQYQDTIITVRYQIDYDLDSLLIGIDRVYWKHADTFKILLYSERADTMFPSGYFLRAQERPNSVPDYYTWKSGAITLYPIPYYAGDSIFVDGRARVSDIMSDTTFVSDFPVTYRPLPAILATVFVARRCDLTEKAAFYWELYQHFAGMLNITVNVGIEGAGE